MADIELYYRDFCGFCARAERLLQSKNVDYKRINIWEVDGAKEEMVQRSAPRCRRSLSTAHMSAAAMISLLWNRKANWTR